MRKEYMRRHWRPLRLTQPRIKNTLQPELRNALVLLDLHAHLKQAIASPDALFQRRPAAADYDGLGGLRYDLEVVCYLRADVVGRGGELGARPELVGGGSGVLVFFGEVVALVGVACFMRVSN